MGQTAVGDGARDAGQLVIASYNVHGCVGIDSRWSPERVAEVIDELGADVVAVQEVHSSPEHAEGDELAMLARRGSYEFLHGPTHARPAGAYGNGLLTRLPVQELRLIDLSQPGREPRGAIDAEMLWDSTRIRVVATHLGLEPRERIAQCRQLLERLTRQDDADLSVLLGDFNEWWVPGRLLEKLHDHFGQPRAVRTYPAFAPLLKLDRIWVKPTGALAKVRAHRSRRTRVASDHLPLRAVIQRPSSRQWARILQSKSANGRAPPHDASGRDDRRDASARVRPRAARGDRRGAPSPPRVAGPRPLAAAARDVGRGGQFVPSTRLARALGRRGGRARAVRVAGRAPRAGRGVAGAARRRPRGDRPARPGRTAMTAAVVQARLLEARLEREKEALAETLEDLGQIARDRTDLRRRVRERPVVWLAGALAIGFWLGASR
jgi:endonuclease/exonuclease/phosphatase family metal-dependent hydrolase